MADGIIQCTDRGWPGAQTPPEALNETDEWPLCGSSLEMVQD